MNAVEETFIDEDRWRDCDPQLSLLLEVMVEAELEASFFS